jgi:hypothetical protein
MTWDKMSVVRMTVDEMSVVRMTVDEMSVVRRTVDEMSLDKMTNHEMTLDERQMPPYKMILHVKTFSKVGFGCYIFIQNDIIRNVGRQDVIS